MHPEGEIKYIIMLSPNPTTNTINSGRTTPSSLAPSGRTTPNATASSVASEISSRITPMAILRTNSLEVVKVEELMGKKPAACNTGIEKGAAAYAAGEHLALQSIMRGESTSFNSSESSPQWGVVHQRMVEEYYGTMDFPPRQSFCGALQCFQAGHPEHITHWWLDQ